MAKEFIRKFVENSKNSCFMKLRNPFTLDDLRTLVIFILSLAVLKLALQIVSMKQQLQELLQLLP